MTEPEIKHYRRRLLALKKRLGGDLTALEEDALRPVGGEAGGGLSDVPVHPADLGTDNYEEESRLDLLENEYQLLMEVNDALDRIEQGTFGRCENCRQEIPRERLEALPYARYCFGVRGNCRARSKNEGSSCHACVILARARRAHPRQRQGGRSRAGTAAPGAVRRRKDRPQEGRLPCRAAQAGAAPHPGFEQFFYQAIKDHILADGRISAEETAWLRQLLFADGKIEDEERKFLHQLKGEAKEVSPEFEKLFEGA